MPPRKEVRSLLSLCSQEVPGLVSSQVTALTTSLVTSWWTNKTKGERQRWNFVNREKVVLASGRVREMEEVVVAGEEEMDFEFREDIDRYDLTHIELNSWVMKVVDEAVMQYREYLMEWPAAHIVNSLAASVIQGIEETIVKKNSQMHLSDKPAVISQLNMEMFLILKFNDLVLVPNLTSLDLRDRLQPVRNHLYDKLSRLPGLRDLSLGEASHGYTPDIFKRQFLAGVSNMTRLVRFSLQFDCFDKLIEILAENCGGSLKLLDVSQSTNVTDGSLESLKKFGNLVDLNIFSCGFTPEGQARLLASLPSLINLRRGDFLSDAVEWLDWIEAEQQPRLQIREFFSSETYHFHTVQQMATVARICPNIVKMRFIFSKEHFISYLNLSAFENLQDLHLCGGDFYDDNLIDLLEAIGHNITHLDLYAVDQIDLKAVAMISIYCTKLVRLGFSQCGFKPTIEELYYEGTEEPQQPPPRSELPVEKLIGNFDNLESLKFSSHAHSDYVRIILVRCRALKHLEIGRAVSMSDFDFSQILCQNPLWQLESFHLKECENPALTIATVENLLDSCPALTTLTDIRSWCGVYRREVEELVGRLQDNNFSLYFGEDIEDVSEQALRRAGLKEKFDRLREQFGDIVMIP